MGNTEGFFFFESVLIQLTTGLAAKHGQLHCSSRMVLMISLATPGKKLSVNPPLRTSIDQSAFKFRSVLYLSWSA